MRKLFVLGALLGVLCLGGCKDPVASPPAGAEGGKLLDVPDPSSRGGVGSASAGGSGGGQGARTMAAPDLPPPPQ